MADKVWPIDMLGNEIREGDLIQLKLDDPHVLFYVQKVEGAQTLHGGEDGNYPVNGQIEIVFKTVIPFMPTARQMGRAIVVKQPKPAA